VRQCDGHLRTAEQECASNEHAEGLLFICVAEQITEEAREAAADQADAQGIHTPDAACEVNQLPAQEHANHNHKHRIDQLGVVREILAAVENVCHVLGHLELDDGHYEEQAAHPERVQSKFFNCDDFLVNNLHAFAERVCARDFASLV